MGAYGGGQYELGVGRGQIQCLAALFHPDAPNDIAPARLRRARSRARPAREPARAGDPTPPGSAGGRRLRVAMPPKPAPGPHRVQVGARRDAAARDPLRRGARGRDALPRRRPGDPRRARRRAHGRRSARASTSAPRSRPRARRSACSCGAWPRRRWRSPSAAPGDLKAAAEKLGQTPPTNRQLLLLRFMGVDRAAPERRPAAPRSAASCS